jgi:hypothetical protein
MLKNHLKPGVKLLGLSSLINTPKDGFDGCYRVASMGTVIAIEFFDARTRTDAATMKTVRILPYRPGMISTVAMGGPEVISGEFTGCVMSVYTKDGGQFAAHVDTNKDTTQRGAYDSLMKQSGVTLQAEYDTTGKLNEYPALDAKTRILCLASGSTIEHYFVQTSGHQFSAMTAPPGAGMHAPKVQGMVTESIYTILPSLGC